MFAFAIFGFLLGITLGFIQVMENFESNYEVPHKFRKLLDKPFHYVFFNPFST